MKAFAIIFILMYSSFASATDYCLAWQVRGTDPHNLVYAKCSNTPKYGPLGIMPNYIDYHSDWSKWKISVQESQQDMENRMALMGFKKVVQIGLYSLYANQPVPYNQICLNVLDPEFEPKVQCATGVSLPGDFAQSLPLSQVFKNNGFQFLVQLGIASVDIPSVDVYVK